MRRLCITKKFSHEPSPVRFTTIVIGEENSAKGTNTDGLVGAFGNFTNNVNSGSFSKKIVEDQAKAKLWIVELKNTSISYTDEVSLDVSLDAFAAQLLERKLASLRETIIHMLLLNTPTVKHTYTFTSGRITPHT